MLTSRCNLPWMCRLLLLSSGAALLCPRDPTSTPARDPPGCASSSLPSYTAAAPPSAASSPSSNRGLLRHKIDSVRGSSFLKLSPDGQLRSWMMKLKMSKLVLNLYNPHRLQTNVPEWQPICSHEFCSICTKDLENSEVLQEEEAGGRTQKSMK